MEPWEDELLWDDDYSDEEEDAEEQIEETGLEMAVVSVYSVRQGYAVAGRSGRWKKQVNAVNRRTAL